MMPVCSEILDHFTDLEQYAFSTTGQPMCIYGDPAYPLRVHLQGPFRDAYLTPQKQLYNQSMNEHRLNGYLQMSKTTLNL